MKQLILLLLLSSAIMACQRTPPANPAALEAWAELIVQPPYRHLKIDPKKFDPEIQVKIAQHATNALKKVVNGCCYSGEEKYNAAIFFDAVTYLIDMNADVQRVPNLLDTANKVRRTHDTSLEYECFTQYLVESDRCSFEALITATLNHLKQPIYTNDDNICAGLISKGLIPRAHQLTQTHKDALKSAIEGREVEINTHNWSPLIPELAQGLEELKSKLK